jgi:hypothetical protein
MNFTVSNWAKWAEDEFQRLEDRLTELWLDREMLRADLGVMIRTHGCPESATTDATCATARAALASIEVRESKRKKELLAFTDGTYTLDDAHGLRRLCGVSPAAAGLEDHSCNLGAGHEGTRHVCRQGCCVFFKET